LEELKEQNRRTIALLQQLLLHQQQQEITNVGPLPNGFVLPLVSTQQVEHLDAQLADGDIKTGLDW